MRRPVFSGVVNALVLGVISTQCAVADSIPADLRAPLASIATQVVTTAELLRVQQVLGEVDPAASERELRALAERLRTSGDDRTGALREQRNQAVERLFNYARVRLAAPMWPPGQSAAAYQARANAQLQTALNLWPTIRARGINVDPFLVPVLEVIGWTNGRTDGARAFDGLDAQIEQVLVSTVSPAAATAATSSAATTQPTKPAAPSPTVGTVSTSQPPQTVQPQTVGAGNCWNLAGWWYLQGLLHVFEPDGTFYAGGSTAPMIRGTWRALDATGQTYEIQTGGYFYRATIFSSGNEIVLNSTPEARGARFSPCGGATSSAPQMPMPPPGSAAGQTQAQAPVPVPIQTPPPAPAPVQPPPAAPKPPVTVAPAPSGPVSLGCYMDDGARDLPGEHIAVTTMTRATCVAHCSGKGFAFAGVQYGDHCFCGNSYGRLGPLPQSRCEEKRCPGNANEWCGGSWSNQIFATSSVAGAPPPRAPPPSGPVSLGCYGDDGYRDLPNEPIQSSTMTRATCMAHCGSKGYAYAGVQYGEYCYCGNSYGRVGPQPQSKCEERRCSGNANEWCGGHWANQIFATSGVAGAPAAPPPPPAAQPTSAACPSISGVWYWQGSQTSAHFWVDIPGPVGTWQYGGGEVVRDWADHADRWGTWECVGANTYRLTRHNGTVYTQVTLRADGKFYDAAGAQAAKGQ